MSGCEIGILVASVAAVDVAVVADPVGDGYWNSWRRRRPPGRLRCAVEHDRFSGMGVDRRDEHRSPRPEQTRQTRGDGGAPLCVPGAVGRRLHVECRRTDAASHVGRILSGGDEPFQPSPGGLPPASPERVGEIRPDRCRCWEAAAEDGGQQVRRRSHQQPGPRPSSRLMSRSSGRLWSRPGRHRAGRRERRSATRCRSIRRHRGPTLARPRRAPGLSRRSAADPGQPPAGRVATSRWSVEVRKVWCSWESPFAIMRGGRSAATTSVARSCTAAEHPLRTLRSWGTHLPAVVQDHQDVSRMYRPGAERAMSGSQRSRRE